MIFEDLTAGYSSARWERQQARLKRLQISEDYTPQQPRRQLSSVQNLSLDRNVYPYVLQTKTWYSFKVNLTVQPLLWNELWRAATGQRTGDGRTTGWLRMCVCQVVWVTDSLSPCLTAEKYLAESVQSQNERYCYPSHPLLWWRWFRSESWN